MAFALPVTSIALSELFAWKRTAQLMVDAEGLNGPKELGQWMWRCCMNIWTLFKNGLASPEGKQRSIEVIAYQRLGLALYATCS